MPFDQIVDVAEAPGLGAVSKNGQVLAPEALAHECGKRPPVLESHPGTVGVEDPHDPGLDAVIAVIGHGHGFGKPLCLIIDAPGSHGIHVPPVVFGLRMDEGVAIALRRRGQQEPGLLGQCQPQGLVRAQRAHLESLDGHSQVIDRARRRGKVKNVVELSVDMEIVRHIVLDEAEALLPQQV